MKNSLKRMLVQALAGLSKRIIRLYKPRIVTVAGSVGKTSTKDAVYAALAATYTARKNQKSFNSEFGVPLTIIDRPNGWNDISSWLVTLAKGSWLVIAGYIPPLRARIAYPEWLVLEFGADKPGDIAALMEWVRPDIAVLTRMGDVPVHVEFFADRDALIAEDAQTAHGTRAEGFLVLNSDDPDIARLLPEAKQRAITYGTRQSASVRAEHYKVVYDTRDNIAFPAGIRFTVTIGEQQFEVERLGIIGEHHMYPVLAAFAVAVGLNSSLQDVYHALHTIELAPSRMRLIPGVKNTMIIDDSYNASPVAAREALAALSKLVVGGGARRIAVLGDMLELGAYASSEHHALGMTAAQAADIIVGIGLRARGIIDGALDAQKDDSKLFHFDRSEDAANFIEELIKPGDIILIKGSQSIRTEKIVREIMAEPDRAAELVCRADEEWGRR